MNLVRWFGLAHGWIGWITTWCTCALLVGLLGQRVIAVTFVTSTPPRQLAVVELVGAFLVAVSPGLLRSRALTWERHGRRSAVRLLAAGLVLLAIGSAAALPWIYRLVAGPGAWSPGAASTNVAAVGAAAFGLSLLSGPVLAGPMSLALYVLAMCAQQALPGSVAWIPLVATGTGWVAAVLVAAVGTAVAAIAWARTLGGSAWNVRRARHDEA